MSADSNKFMTPLRY